MSNPKISVIIPVYNSEKYLQQCLDSVINQTLKDIEIICIDDNSTDKSHEILKEYQNSDSRIKLIKNIKNEGVSNSRNTALSNASGEYLLFVDSDDIISDNCAFETLYTLASNKNVDILLFNYCMFNESKKTFKRCTLLDSIYNLFGNQVFSLTEGARELFYVHGTVCGKLYKNSIIQNNNILFYKKMNIGEDLFFYIKAVLNSERFLVLNNVYYYYRKGNNTLSQTIDNFVEQQVEACEKLFTEYKDLAKKDNPYRKKILDRNILLLQINFDQIKNKQKEKEAIRSIKKNFLPLIENYNKKELKYYKELRSILYRKLVFQFLGIKLSIKIPRVL